MPTRDTDSLLGRRLQRQSAQQRIGQRPAASALMPTAAVVATAAPDGAEMRSRSDTGRENSNTGQSRADASRRRARSGLTTLGWPTTSSIGMSVIESE